MSNFTHETNYTEPTLPEFPLVYFEDYYKKILLWMSPLLLLTVWVNMYIVFNSCLFLLNCIIIVEIIRIKLYVQENLNVRKVVTTV